MAGVGKELVLRLVLLRLRFFSCPLLLTLIFYFFFLGDFTLSSTGSLTGGVVSMSVVAAPSAPMSAVAVSIVAMPSAPCCPPLGPMWPVRREVRSEAEGGETTAPWALCCIWFCLRSLVSLPQRCFFVSFLRVTFIFGRGVLLLLEDHDRHGVFLLTEPQGFLHLGATRPRRHDLLGRG